MRASFFAGLGLIGAAAMVDACSVSTSSTPPDNDLPTFCADYAKAMCQVTTACNVDSPAACISFQTSACTSTYSPQVMGSRTYNQPNGKACIDKLTAAYTSTTVTADTLKDVATTCNKVVIGNLQTNGICTGDNDCSGSLVCTPYGSQMRCGPVTMKNLMDPCADPGDTCTGDSYCAPQAGGGAPVCTATPAMGQMCSATIPCGATLRCVNGACAARASSGDPCTSGGDCTSGFCDVYYGQCAVGLAFAHGSDDCKGILGTSQPDDGGMVIAQPEAGSTETGSPTPEGGDGAMTSSEGGD